MRIFDTWVLLVMSCLIVRVRAFRSLRWLLGWSRVHLVRVVDLGAQCGRLWFEEVVGMPFVLVVVDTGIAASQASVAILFAL